MRVVCAAGNNVVFSGGLHDNKYFSSLSCKLGGGHVVPRKSNQLSRGHEVEWISRRTFYSYFR